MAIVAIVPFSVASSTATINIVAVRGCAVSIYHHTGGSWGRLKVQGWRTVAPIQLMLVNNLYSAGDNGPGWHLLTPYDYITIEETTGNTVTGTVVIYDTPITPRGRATGWGHSGTLAASGSITPIYAGSLGVAQRAHIHWWADKAHTLLISAAADSVTPTYAPLLTDTNATGGAHYLQDIQLPEYATMTLRNDDAVNGLTYAFVTWMTW